MLAKLDLHEQIDKAIKSGALVPYEARLDPDQFPSRCLWMTQVVKKVVTGDELQEQGDKVRAALRRYVLGGRVSILANTSTGKSVPVEGDIRHLKGYLPNFVEYRFRPPKFQFRLFGRFMNRDQLILSSHGAKNDNGFVKGFPTLNVKEQYEKMQYLLARIGLSEWNAPANAADFVSNGRVDS